MVVVHGQVHAAAGDAGLVREDGQRGLVLAVVPFPGGGVVGRPHRRRRGAMHASTRAHRTHGSTMSA